MSLDPGFSPLADHEVPRRKRQRWWIAAALAGVLGLSAALWFLGYRPARFGSPPALDLSTATVDRGDVTLIVTESGSLEGADDSVIRCEVESFLGLPLATPKRPSPEASSVGSLAAMKPASAAAGSQTRSAASVGTLPAGGAAASATPSAAALPDAGIPVKAPKIRSFDYVVQPHVALRANAPDPVIRTGAPPRPPTILSILPEGTCVRAGDVVCELESAAFRLEYQAQKVRYVQMKAWVDQARSLLAVNEITLKEYEEGIFPQDMELIKQYITTRETIKQQATQNLAWSRMTVAKGYRSSAQLKADTGALLDAEIRLREAKGMLERLVNYTARRIIAAQKAKIEAIRADMLALASSFELATQRLNRIGAMIAHCTMRAPRDGIVVYANRTNLLGISDAQIHEGLVVYQTQPIFRMLDTKAMQVKARINESQVARLKPGMPALIRFDAFADRPVRGTVAEITAIPAPLNVIASDVRAYLATVRIEAGAFNELRNGLSAQVEILVETHRNVPRVPLGAIRWASGRSFAAVLSNTGSGPAWKWRPVSLGVNDTRFAEVLSGLEPGNRVIAHPELLPGPRVRVASAAG